MNAREDAAWVADTITQLRAENDELRHHNAALIEIVRDSPCPYDGRATVGECQQCGCSHGLMIRPVANEQGINPVAD